MNKIQAIWYWTLAKSHRTWFAHCLIGLLLAPVVGAWTMMVFYVLRECEQVFTTWLARQPQDWQDHILDVSPAFVALGLYSLIA
jgi:DNA-binding HxlR family transcriptional regulator